MKQHSLTLVCLSILFRLGLSLSPSYLACQLQKLNGDSPLAGCPQGTVYVSPTDQSAQFDNIQEAIDSLPETSSAVILIGEGQYFEMINVTRPLPLTLLGQLDPSTANVPSGNASQRNLVHIWNNRCVGEGYTDEETATLTIGPSLGNPFGNTDFRAYNINFENRAADVSITQALAISITLANASFYGCTFASYQDTWFTGWEASSYVVDSIIFGQTDYLFGLGNAWFESVTLANRGCGGGITAWAGIPGTTSSGVYVSQSKIIRSPDASADVMTDESCYLGRPWNENAVSVFLNTYMDDSVNPSGFTSWLEKATIPDTTYYAEFNSSGPGGSSSARISEDHILSTEEAQKYTLEYVFQGKPRWVDGSYAL